MATGSIVLRSFCPLPRRTKGCSRVERSCTRFGHGHGARMEPCVWQTRA
jgi:hypothetical protein